MRIFRFLFTLLLTCALIWFLQVPHQLGDKSLPPFGVFFNPFSGFWKNAEPATGFSNKNAHIPSLSGQVEVVYDDLLVPHIFAGNAEDAAMAQGYVTAANRLWQMDITTRKAAGRLSEVLGDRTLAIDRLTRRRGMMFAAENDLLGWQKSPETMRLLTAYTAGVNAYLQQLSPADYPVEFKLLNYQPEPWSELKTALVIESMAENLSSAESDLAATNTRALLGQAAFDMLFPELDSLQQPVVADTGQWKELKVVLPPGPAPLGATSGIFKDRQPTLYSQNEDPDNEIDPYLKGSNNWAVSGARTQSHYPILANDPHLNLTLPSIWYQVQIHTPDQNCYGVSLPGVPGVVIGFNENIAWGVTNVSHDVSDWYQIKWTNAERTTYDLDGEVREVQKRIETIGIKGQAPLIDTVRYTVWGPVTHDFEPDHPLFDCALRWISHDMPEPQELGLFLILNAGKGYEDYRKAIASFDCPAQNFVFATRSGDIAIQVQGRFPVRGPEQGRFVQDGSHWANAWHSFIPEDQVPSMKNPSRGFVFSANQVSAAPAYPYYYLGNFDHYRGRHIYDRLAALQNATVDSMKTIQLDNFSQRAHDALPAMLALLNRPITDADGQNLLQELSAWNYRYDAAMTAPPLFEVWYDSCYLQTWDELDVLRKQGKDIELPETWRFNELLATDTANVFFDHPNTPQRETARDIVNESFRAMQHYFQKNPQKRIAWAPYRGFALKHLAQIDAFSRLDVEVGGHKSAPNALNRTNGPSWRMIVDLGDPVRGYGVFPGGQSGNPGSRYYDNMVNAWAKGEYYDLLLLRSPDEAPERIQGRQILTAN
ncbi:MAG: penicillin acylase family protein [Saprospiraceae bacterium]